MLIESHEVLVLVSQTSVYCLEPADADGVGKGGADLLDLIQPRIDHDQAISLPQEIVDVLPITTAQIPDQRLHAPHPLQRRSSYYDQRIEPVIAFASEIYHGRLEGIPIGDLLAEIEHLQRSDPGISRSNVGGYHSAPLRPSASQPTLQTLERLASEQVRQIAEILGLGPLRMNGLWANISAPGDRNEWHIHPFTCLSAVFYVQTPERSGRLILERPDAQSHFWRRSSEDDARSRHHLAIQPSAGDLIVFPAYLRHQVEPNMSGDLRISCAMNFAY